MKLSLQNVIQCLKEKKVSILPHDNADVDAVVSAVLLSKLFNYLEIDNEILILDQRISDQTGLFLEKLGYYPEQYFCQEEDEKRNLFLVDHYETLHLGKVVGCIDHHFTSQKLCYPIYEYRNSCSTSYILYTFMEEIKMPITKEIVALVGYASLIDTCSFKSTKTKKEEADIVLALLEKYQFPVEKIVEECLCIQDITIMSIEQIATNGMKQYQYGDFKVGSSYVQITSLEIPVEVLDYIQKEIEKKNLFMWIFLIFDMKDTKTKVYYVQKENRWSVMFDKIISRGKDIMPMVESAFMMK